MSTARMQRRLSELEQRPRPARVERRHTWDLACFTDEELEQMVPLAEKVEALGNAVEWTAAEIVLVEQLDQVYRDRCPSVV